MGEYNLPNTGGNGIGCSNGFDVLGTGNDPIFYDKVP